MLQRPVGIPDLLRLRIPLDPRVSPDGSRVLFTLKTTDTDAQLNCSNLSVGQPGQDARPFTTGSHKDWGGRWSPDGRWVAFFTNRRVPKDGQLEKKERTRLAVLPTDGGEIRFLTDLDATYGSFAWSPDSRRVVLSFRRNDPIPLGMTHLPAIRVTNLFYKLNGSGYLPKDRYHLYLLEFAPAATPVQITDGEWDDTEPVFSPDGRHIAFLSNRGPERYLDVENRDVWIVKSAGGDPRQLSTLRGEAWGPVFSADGRHLAFVKCVGPRGNSMRDNAHVYLVAAQGNAPEWDLTPELDRPTLNMTLSDTLGTEHIAPSPAFGPSDRAVTFVVSDQGTTYLARVAVVERGSTPGKIERLFDAETVGTFHMARPDGPVALLLTSHTEPGQLRLVDANGQGSWPVADPNRAWKAELLLEEPELHQVVTPEGHRIDGWLLRPEGDGPHPLLLYIHGGPHLQYGNGFFHEFQWLRSEGYAVLFCNPRGSQGYGRDFTWAISRDWGTGPHADLMLMLDRVLATGGLDPARLGVLGGSYGGFMSLWMIAHTDRFRAACTQRTVFDMAAMTWADFGVSLADEFGATPWDDPELYRRLSPLTYADRIHTPLLITQGLADHRTPADQGERTFVTLKRMGRTVEMVLFPEADHDLSRKGPPPQRCARLEAIGEWFSRYLKLPPEA
jgi:dipeptidyl aminopeptidase/acylaminoacyl peptidase